MLLLLHKGRSVFSHLSPYTFQVLSFLPSAVILSSLAAEGGGRENTHRGRWLIFRSTCARGWENSATAASSSTSPHHSCPAHMCAPAPVYELCGLGSAAGGLESGLRGGSWTYTPLSSKRGAALASTPPAQTHSRACREGAAVARWSLGNPLPWQLVGA